MILHLVPEFFAITTLLKGEGISTKRSAFVDISGIGVLIISFILFRLLLLEFSETVLNELAALSGGAFLYIGMANFLKRPKTVLNIVGAFTGLLVVALWTFVVNN